MISRLRKHTTSIHFRPHFFENINLDLLQTDVILVHRMFCGRGRKRRERYR